MKSFLKFIIPGFLFSFVSLHAETSDVLVKMSSLYHSPIDGVAWKITEQNILTEFQKKAIADGEIEEEEAKAITIPFIHMLYSTKDGIRIRTYYTNLEYHDFYLHENSLYSMFSLSKKFWNIYKADSEEGRVRLSSIVNNLNGIFIKPERFKEILKIADSIEEGSDSYIISYEEDGNSVLFEVDKKTGIPVKKEIFYPNGNIEARFVLKKTDKGFNLNAVAFLENGDAFFEINNDIEVLDDAAFDKKFVPENMGYGSVMDHRSGKRRDYFVFDKFPSEDFINALFKNPDDVVRYNTEIHRLAHPLEFEEE